MPRTLLRPSQNRRQLLFSWHQVSHRLHPRPLPPLPRHLGFMVARHRSLAPQLLAAVKDNGHYQQLEEAGWMSLTTDVPSRRTMNRTVVWPMAHPGGWPLSVGTSREPSPPPIRLCKGRRQGEPMRWETLMEADSPISKQAARPATPQRRCCGGSAQSFQPQRCGLVTTAASKRLRNCCAGEILISRCTLVIRKSSKSVLKSFSNCKSWTSLNLSNQPSSSLPPPTTCRTQLETAAAALPRAGRGPRHRRRGARQATAAAVGRVSANAVAALRPRRADDGDLAAAADGHAADRQPLPRK